MPSAVHMFSPGDTVFYITDDCEETPGLRDEMLKIRIQEAVVQSVGIFIDDDGTTITYSVKNSTSPFTVTQAFEEDTFGDLTSASAEYATRLSALT